MKLIRKIIQVMLVLVIAGCSTGINQLGLVNKTDTFQLSKAEYAELEREFSFKTEALSESYILRKLKKLIAFDQSLKVVKFLDFARQKGTDLSDLIKSVITGNADIKTYITSSGDINIKRQENGAFNLFIANILGTPQTLAGNVTTLAGNGDIGFNDSTDSTGATARFYYPDGVAVDGSGNVYVADGNNQKIRKISPAGNVTTLAGNGNSGFSDSTDGTGATAKFTYPNGVAVDSNGNVFVADTGNHKIRKITPSGNVTTFAGGNQGFSDSTDGTGATAQFNFPSGVAVDTAGNVYVADSNNQKIRKISLTGNVTTLAGGNSGFSDSTDGTGATAMFFGPIGVSVDSSGNVYVADMNNQKIRKISPAGNVTTLAGGNQGFNDSTDGTGATAQFSSPQGVAVDNSGNVYVSDGGNNKIRKITSAGNVSTLAGSNNGFSDSTDGTGATAQFSSPQGVAVDNSGKVYVADVNNQRIRKIE
jgi:sugar lactone lactonase YvrE